MARPLRLEFEIAPYHLTSRGDRREDIYLGDQDRLDWLSILSDVSGSFIWNKKGVRYVQAQLRYIDYVRAGVGQESIWKALKGQAFLGDEQFVKQMLSKVEASKNNGVNALKSTNPWQEIGLKPRHAARLPVTEYLSQTGLARNEAILAAFKQGAYSMKDIALGLGLHYTTVSKVVWEKR